MNSGEAPATISKLKRRRRGKASGGSGTRTDAGKLHRAASALPTIDEDGSNHNAANRRDDEVDRVFDLLGLPKTHDQGPEASRSQPSFHSQAEAVHDLNSCLNGDLPRRPSSSPIGRRKLSYDAGGAGRRGGPSLQRSHTHPPRGGRRNRAPLPSLRHRRVRGSRRDAEKENAGNEGGDSDEGKGHGEDKGQDREKEKSEEEDNDTENLDLFREIELGLDRAAAAAKAGADAGAGAGIGPTPSGQLPVAEESCGRGDGALRGGIHRDGNGNDDKGTRGKGRNNGDGTRASDDVVREHSVDGRIGNDGRVRDHGRGNITDGTCIRSSFGRSDGPGTGTGAVTGTTGPGTGSGKGACNGNARGQATVSLSAAASGPGDDGYDFGDDDDDWDAADLAAIDLSVSMTQTRPARSSVDSSAVGAPLRRSASLPATTSVAPPHRSASLPVGAASTDAGKGEADEGRDCYEFDVDDDDLAEIDLGCQRSSLPASTSSALPHRSASLPVGTASTNARKGEADGQDSFEFDVDDDDLAAIDLSVAATQSLGSSRPASRLAIGNPDMGDCGNAPDFDEGFNDDDDFGDVDLAAIDLSVAAAMTQQQCRADSGKGPNAVPIPPPLDAPVRNPRLEGCRASQQGGEPRFLSFTRYVVRSVHEDLCTFTKTVGVTMWTPSHAEDVSNGRDEVERLRKAIDGDDNGRTKSLAAIDGHLHLRGDWYYVETHPGDVVHLCSLAGLCATGPRALPVTLHSAPPPGSDLDDDLALVVHPDEPITPTLVSEAVRCPRLATLQSRLGSTGLSARSAVVGTLRHALFERCLRERDASGRSAARFTRNILRDNAEGLVGCGVARGKEVYGEVMRTMPQVRAFLSKYTSWDATGTRGLHHGSRSEPTALLEGTLPPSSTLLSIEDVRSTEEWAHVPELGLKGNVDATVCAWTRPPDNAGDGRAARNALMAVELKTGHKQSLNHSHLAQLSLYTVMLRARHGSSRDLDADGGHALGQTDHTDAIGAGRGGMLLYLNHENHVARHVKPSSSDVRALIGQRNEVACNVRRAARPRGVRVIQYEEEGSNRNGSTCGKVVVEDPPPSALPSLSSDVRSCEWCYKNRECMTYAAVDGSSAEQHGKLLRHFAGHLTRHDLDYLRKWDRLIDLEHHASVKEDVARSWLYDSGEREARDGKCASSLVLDRSKPSWRASDGTGRDEEDDVRVHFLRSKDSPLGTPLSSLNFETGCRVMVSEDATPMAPETQRGNVVRRRGMHILRGCVVAIGELDIVVAVPRKDISTLARLIDRVRNNGVVKFRLDKEEYFGSCGLLRQNLVNFFTLDIPSFSAESLGSQAKTRELTADTEYSARRRRLNGSIVALDPPPRFRNLPPTSLFDCSSFALDASVPGCDVASLRQDYARLNPDQKGALLKAVSAEDFALVQGLPGTGKSATIAFITRLLVMQGKRVLLTSYTHSAVDNLLRKLIDSGVVPSSPTQAKAAQNPIIRIGRETACHPEVHSLLAQKVACEAEQRESKERVSIEKPSVDFLHKVVTDAKVVGVSALSAPRSPLLAGQHFDVVIVDEAGQISQPAILGAIMAADKFVLVGDHMQLPPLVVSEVAEEAGYGISMLMHLAEAFPSSVAKLTLQYRMNEEICHLSNLIAYKGLLKCGNDNVRYQKLNIDISKNLHIIDPIDRPWIARAIDPNHPVVFVDTDGKGWLESDGTKKGAGGPTNHPEASIVEKIVASLSACGLEKSSIGVITPFRSQLRLLNDNPSLGEFRSLGLEMCTIDRFQGRDKSAIIVSLVRSNQEGKAGRLLQDFRRLNVAFSRAKEKMIIVGSFSTMRRGSDVMRPLLDSLRHRNWVYALSN
ncbi:hypothetical protein ACHAWF_016524 [Thalassiosira exigua]